MTNKYINHILKNDGSFELSEFKSDISKNFDDPLELYFISEAMCMIGRFEDSIKIYNRILELNDKWIDIFDLTARCHWAIHDYKSATKFWSRYQKCREEEYKKLSLPNNFFTIDRVFTESFGNYAFLYPIFKKNYKNNNEIFNYHPDVTKDLNSKVISNKWLFDFYNNYVNTNLNKELDSIIQKNNQITRLPFYSGMNLIGKPTHFQNAFAEKMIDIEKNINVREVFPNIEINNSIRSSLNNLGLDLNKEFIALHVRESGYWNRKGNKTHSTKNANIETYLPAIKYLIDQGLQVVRLGDMTMKKIPRINGLIDYALSKYKSDNLDIFFLKSCKFLISTCSGPFQVAGIFNTPMLATNWIPIHILPYSNNDTVLLKKIKKIKTNEILSFNELLKLDFAEFSFYNLLDKGLKVEDNNDKEILNAVKYTLKKLSKNFKYSLVENIKKLNTSYKFKKYKIISKADIFTNNQYDL